MVQDPPPPPVPPLPSDPLGMVELPSECLCDSAVHYFPKDSSYMFAALGGELTLWPPSALPDLPPGCLISRTGVNLHLIVFVKIEACLGVVGQNLILRTPPR